MSAHSRILATITAMMLSCGAIAQQQAPSCVRVEYSELKEMSQERLQRTLCGVRRIEGSLRELIVTSYLDKGLSRNDATRHRDLSRMIEVNSEACKAEAERIIDIAAQREIKLDDSHKACAKSQDQKSVTLGQVLSEHHKSSLFSNAWSGTYTIPAGPVVKLQDYGGGVLYSSPGATFSHSLGTISPIAGIFVPNDPEQPVRVFWKDHTAGSGGEINIGQRQYPRNVFNAE